MLKKAPGEAAASLPVLIPKQNVLSKNIPTSSSLSGKEKLGKLLSAVLNKRQMSLRVILPGLHFLFPSDTKVFFPSWRLPTTPAPSEWEVRRGRPLLAPCCMPLQILAPGSGLLGSTS